ncbi:polymeric immunoglobulin receptor-like [Pseudoliparis swirei]|uniref:polymeric immunoglobulin receptor-like n=1 Tax=Pseudoliparis swirei TaxID=2059687 RepID=UPI0024BEA12C|nr:polymeric immunoglobulin receptor-like [Pseudoliparis swirei]
MKSPLRVLLILTGLTGILSITTVSKVSVKTGDSISIPCLYGSTNVNRVKYLCKGDYWSSCNYAVKTNQKNSRKFSISDDKIQRIFTVTVKDLMDKDTGYYWCAVEINQGSDVKEYFHLSVTKGTPKLYTDLQNKTGFERDNLTINCNYSNHGEIRWCKLGRSCVTPGSSGSIDGTAVTINASVPNVFTVTMSGLKKESSGWYQCVKGDLQMPVHVTVNEPPTTKQTKSASSAMTAEEEVTYSNVDHTRNTSNQRSNPERDADVTYSSVVTIRKKSIQRVEAKDENVTYSTLA